MRVRMVCGGLAAVCMATLSSFTSAGVVLDLEDKTIDLSLVTLPYTFTYSIVSTSTAPDTGKQILNLDTKTTFSPAMSGVELLNVTSSLPNFAGATVNPAPPSALTSQVIAVSAFSSAPSLPAGPTNIMTYTMRINSMPPSTVTYNTAITGLVFKEAVSGNPSINATLQGGFITFISAIPEPLVAGSLLLLSGRILARRSRLSM